MKLMTGMVAVVALLALAGPPAVAQDKGKDAAPAAPVPAQVDAQFAKMQEQMRLMQTQMEKIGKTQDPKERQRLLEEHWTAMQAMMVTMHNGSPGMGHMMGGHMRWKDYRGLTPEQLRERQYMMDRWMPMQQMMMEQMMQHQHWMMPPPKEAR